MKKLVLTTFVLFVLVLPILAADNEDNMKPTLYLGGGASIPTGTFRSDFKTGFNLGGGVGLQLNSMFEVIGRLNYSRFPLDQTKFLANEASGTTVDGGAAKILNIAAELRYYMPTSMARLRPYLLGRLGAAHLTQSDLTLTQGGLMSTTSYPGSTKFTWGLGAGTNIALNQNLALWIEGKFDGVNTPIAKTDYVPIQAGLRYMFGKKL